MMNKMIRTLTIVLAAASLTTAVFGTTASAAEIFEEVPSIEMENKDGEQNVICDVEEETPADSSIIAFEDVTEEAAGVSPVVNTEYAVATVDLALKNAPGEASARIGAVRRGTQVRILNRVSEPNGSVRWYQVEVNGAVGYVSGWYGNLKEISTPTPTPTPTPTRQNYVVTVSQGALALRSSAATTTTNQIGFLPNGSTVQVTGPSVNGFAYVYVTNGPASSYGRSMTGMSGYVNAAYLRAI